MTFQRGTARKHRRARPRAQAVGARSSSAATIPSLAPEVYEDPAWDVDVDRPRRRRHHVPRAAARARARRAISAASPGCPIATAAGFVRTPDRAGQHARRRGGARCRTARPACSTGYTFLGRPIDVVETSRGCTYDCSFCSIIEMRGRNFHTWSIERVLADIADARARGARAIFIVDDNITLNVARFEALCRAIVDGRPQRHRLHRAGDDLVDRGARRDAGAADARGRLPLRVPRHREHPRRGSRVPARARQERARARPGARSATRPSAAIDVLHRHGMFVVGGLIVGNPQRHARVDRGQPRVRARVRRLAVHPASDAVSRHADDAGLPRARPDRQRRRRRVRRHDSGGAKRASRRPTEIEFMRWRAERWMKLRHFWPVLAHSPLVRAPARPRDARPHVPRRSWRSLLGPRERARRVRALQDRFARMEREYL